MVSTKIAQVSPSISSAKLARLLNSPKAKPGTSGRNPFWIFSCDQGFVGLRSTVAKKHPARSGLADQSARKLSLVWIAKQIAGVDQLTGLALHRRDPVRMTMTQRADGDARGEVEKLPPQIIPDPGALSANQRERGSRIVLQNVRVVEFGGAGANNGRTAHENIG
jgi:hypothetical protein